MKRWSGPLAAAAIAFAVAIPAQAQDTKKQIQGYIGGGYSQPMGIADDYLDGGFNIAGGVIWRPAPSRPFGLRADLGYDWWDASNKAVQLALANGLRVDGGSASMWSLTADALWEFGGGGKVGGFVGAGIGGYRRYFELTNAVVLPGYICDPWYGWCYPAAVPGDVIAADDTLTKFGYNVSAGITFPVGDGDMYVEARYHWMDTSPTTEFLPILIGYRF